MVSALLSVYNIHIWFISFQFYMVTKARIL